jgi:hypothetical protein
MGITQLIDPYYQPIASSEFRKFPRIGQFCWVPIVNLDGIPRLLEVERADPTEHYATRFLIRNMGEKDFKKKNRLPIKKLSLRETEELIIYRAKKRPAIIIAMGNTCFDDITLLLKSSGKTHLQQANCLFILPLYGIETEDHEGGFPAAMVARIKALMYQQFFYFPREKSPLIFNSVGRLDRIQPLLYHHDVINLEPFSLSPEALSILLGFIRILFGGEEDDLLKTIKELVLESLPNEARP